MASRRPIVLAAALVSSVLTFSSSAGPVWANDPLPTPTLVEDLNADGVGSDPDHPVSVGDTLFFTIQPDDSKPPTLIEVDAQSGDTSVVDLPDDASIVRSGVAFEDRVIFPASGPTPMLLVVEPGNGVVEIIATSAVPDDLAAGQRVVFFSVDDELWITDGTESGTEAVTTNSFDVILGVVASVRDDGAEIAYVRARGDNGTELFRVDPGAGPGGTARVVEWDLNMGPGSSNPSSLVVVDGVLWFRAFDGTSISAYSVANSDIPLDPILRRDGNVQWLLASRDVVFVGEWDGTTVEVRRFQGMGSTSILDIEADGTSAFGTVLDGAVLFRVRVGIETSLWLAPTVGNAGPLDAGGDALFPITAGLAARDGSYAVVPASTVSDDQTGASSFLWSIDPDGNVEPVEANGDWDGFQLNRANYPLVAVGDSQVSFVSGSARFGAEPHLSDGTTSGTRVIDDFVVGTVDSSPRSEVVRDGRMYFRATQGLESRYFEYDPADESLTLVPVVPPSLAAGDQFIVRSDWFPLGDDWGFIAEIEGATESQFSLYRLPLAGGAAVEVVGSLSTDDRPRDPVVTDTHLFFRLTQGSPDRLMSVPLDASTLPTLISEVSISFEIAAVGGGVVFRPDRNVPDGAEPMFSDGGLAVVLRDIVGGPGDSNPRDFLEFGGRVLFEGDGVWATDGTMAGTVELGAEFGLFDLGRTDGGSVLILGDDDRVFELDESDFSLTEVDTAALPDGFSVRVFRGGGHDGTHVVAVHDDDSDFVAIGVVSNGVLSIRNVEPPITPDDDIEAVVVRNGIVYLQVERESSAWEWHRIDPDPAQDGRFWVQPADTTRAGLVELVGDRVVFEAQQPAVGEELFSFALPPVPGPDPDPDPDPDPESADVVSLVPRRFLESRVGEVTFDGEGQLGRRVAAGETVRVRVTGRGGVPAGTSGVVANVTAVFPSGPGFVTVWDCVGDPPTASSLNYGPGQVVPNELVAKLSVSGELCLFSLAETDLLVDVVGLVPAGSSLVSLAPRRFLESRVGEVTFDGEGQLGRRVGAGETVRVQVTGRGGIAAGTSGVVANVTAVFPSGPGFVTVWDCVGDPPTASSLNYGPGSVVPNELVAKLSSSGELCLFSLAETDLLVDVAGLVPAGSDLVSLSPARFLESRAGEVTFDGAGQLGRRVAAGETVRVDVAGRGDVPAGATGVVANVTAVFPSGPGFVTVWDCAGDPPTASSLNYGPGSVVPNELIAKLSSTGELCLFTLAETDLLVDIVGAIT